MMILTWRQKVESFRLPQSRKATRELENFSLHLFFGGGGCAQSMQKFPRPQIEPMPQE